MKVFLFIISLMLVEACIAKVIIEYESDGDEYDYTADGYFETLDELHFPSDCNANRLINFSRQCGLNVTAGGSHWIVKDENGNIVTIIPHSVKENPTCRSIIKDLNALCA